MVAAVLAGITDILKPEWWFDKAGSAALPVVTAIVFAESGLLFGFFLPGDSLLFAAGALAATGGMDVRILAGGVFLAAISGDLLNYSVGRAVGTRVIQLARTDPRWGRFIRPAYIDRPASSRR